MLIKLYATPTLFFHLSHVDRFMQMVLDAGNIVKFGKPSELLKIKGGKLKALIDESSNKDTLYQMTQ